MYKKNLNVMDLFDECEMVKICAPMVRYSKLQFRNLVRGYNCDLCFSSMILADSFHKSIKARRHEFKTSLGDTPVIIQFAANNVNDFVTAACLACPYVSGVDLNCGCPQRWANDQGVGCVMLENPQKIFEITRNCRNRICKPFSVSVKTRILHDLKKSVEICRQIEKAGASFLTIHARYSGQTGGVINEEALKIIKDNINIPLVANGGMKSLNDCLELKERVNCDGVMIANGILENPAVFSGAKETPIECVQKWVDICYNSTLSDEAYAALTLTNSQPTILERPVSLTFQCFHHHLVFMLEKILPKNKRRLFNSMKKFNEVLEFLKEELCIVPKLFNSDEFRKYKPLYLEYEHGENHLYLSGESLVEDEIDESIVERDGKFFESKVEESSYEYGNWTDMFDEN
ncbi:tRNA-dihydrouridine(20a/20b) synthase [NAD(P)+]-like [Coccinella septempunctata]|uniref:tRNA-dihydrouridine(20a/20b) synthase [NAD(P)+]-like n=1 Tax=Coccinella septempunctata TaxID=41139 RepID=UPI001D0721DE|nr:tRNA-dihydrouridine(20a/20b) synthase [NAD(P)+]-like [Coccinella septempunctata]